ncbi:MAG TPA: hypothetical protein VK509_24900 [Polyangiales bacterium]|nr:hypothetical protein [Polyangiales bacterium]
MAQAFGAAGIPATVTESVPGRWTASITKAARDARADAGNAEKVREAEAAAQLRMSSSVLLRDKGEALATKQRIDEEIRSLKTRLGDARRRAATEGVYLPRKELQRLYNQLEAKQQESQALQVTIGRLGREARANGVEDAGKTGARTRPERKLGEFFIDIAKATLPKDVFDELLTDALDAQEEHQERASAGADVRPVLNAGES